MTFLNVSPVGALLGILWSLLAMYPILLGDAVWDMVDTYKTLPRHRRKGFWKHHAWRPLSLPYVYVWTKVRNYYDYSHAEYCAYQAGSWLRSDAGRRSYREWDGTYH